MATARGRSGYRTFEELGAWAGLTPEGALEPELPIVDAHHHLYEDERGRYLLEEFARDMSGGHNIAATVFVECRAAYRTSGPEASRVVGETEFALEMGERGRRKTSGSTDFCAAIVGTATLSQGASVGEILEAHLAAGKGRFRGIRDPLQWDDTDAASHGGPRRPAKGLSRDGRFREGYAKLAEYGLSFDAWLFHTQLDELAELARAAPRVPIALNHVGAPIGVGPYAGRREEVFAVWRRSMDVLALCPNISVKVGGLGMILAGFDFHRRPAAPASAALAAAWRPYIEYCIDTFGPERCMFQSNYPADKQSAGYTAIWNAFKIMTAGYSDAEKAALYHGTAAKFYRIPGSPGGADEV